MENAIHKMSGLTARHLGLKDRGTISVGNYADLVLIDPEIVNDKATLQDSHAISEGIERVWVNGKVIYQHKKSMGSYSGMLVKRPE
jgi:N-acyl-D-aspartate/D-glutamate deacylase